MEEFTVVEQNYRVNLCRKIRRIANSRNVVVDLSEHRSGRNLHLISYIKYCGRNPDDFIIEYLRNLQPYMIKPFDSQKYRKDIICVLDEMYRISLYIKADTKQHEEVIVSFHENNEDGIAKSNALISAKSDFLSVPVFFDSIRSRVVGTNKVVARVYIQRGMLTLPLYLAGTMISEDIILVNPLEIKQFFIDEVNTYLTELCASDLNLNPMDIKMFTSLHQLSFTSFGRDTISTFSLLVDSFELQTDRVGRAVADFAIVTYAQMLQLTEQQIKDLLAIIKDRYTVAADRNMQLLITRIEENLKVNEVVLTDQSINEASFEARALPILTELGHPELINEFMASLPENKDDYDDAKLKKSAEALLFLKGLRDLS